MVHDPPQGERAGGGGGANRIDKDRYLSRSFLELEFERLWSRVWQLAGHFSDLPRDGSYFTYEIGSDSLLIVRDGAEVRAFHNVCRHRGRILREPGMGHAASFRCPYHHWEWWTDGRLKNIPSQESFPDLGDLECLGLRRVDAEVWGGFVWVNLSEGHEPLAEFLGSIGDRLAAYHTDEFALTQDQTAEVDCNWKIPIDASNESYHIAVVHPELLQVYDDLHVYPMVLEGRHGVGCAPFLVPSGRLENSEELNDWLRQFVEEAGLDPNDFVGKASEVRSAVQKAIRSRSDEFDFSDLTDDQLTDYCSYFFFPNVHFNIQGMNLNISRSRPHPTDPGKTLLDQWNLVRIGRGGKRPERPQREVFRFGEKSLGFVTDQDVFNYARVHRGLQSSGFETVILGDQEQRVRHMHEVLDGYLFPDR